MTKSPIINGVQSTLLTLNAITQERRFYLKLELKLHRWRSTSMLSKMFCPTAQTEKSIQETITAGQIERLMAILDEIMAGRPIKVKGSYVTPRKVAMGNLYLKIAAPYALRQGSIMDLRPSDFSYENLTYRIQKGENKGVPVTRPMNNMTWDAYEQYLAILGHRPEKLFNDASWLSAFCQGCDV